MNEFVVQIAGLKVKADNLIFIKKRKHLNEYIAEVWHKLEVVALHIVDIRVNVTVDKNRKKLSTHLPKQWYLQAGVYVSQIGTSFTQTLVIF